MVANHHDGGESFVVVAILLFSIFDNIDIGDLLTPIQAPMLPIFDVRCVHRPNSSKTVVVVVCVCVWVLHCQGAACSTFQTCILKSH